MCENGRSQQMTQLRDNYLMMMIMMVVINIRIINDGDNIHLVQLKCKLPYPLIQITWLCVVNFQQLPSKCWYLSTKFSGVKDRNSDRALDLHFQLLPWLGILTIHEEDSSYIFQKVSAAITFAQFQGLELSGDITSRHARSRIYLQLNTREIFEN